MLLQALGLAVLAAISPTELLVAAVYLGSKRPRATLLCFLAGALVIATVLGIAILIALRSGHLQFNNQRQPRYGLRLGLGIIALGAAAFMARRASRARDFVQQPKGDSAQQFTGDSAQQSKGIVSRLIANPAPVTAFMTGLLLFGPSVTFFAAVQVIGTSQASDAVTALSLALVIVIDVMIAWLAFLAYLIAPGPTARRLTAFNTWLQVHGRLITMVVLAVAGVLLTVNGLLGLIQKT